MSRYQNRYESRQGKYEKKIIIRTEVTFGLWASIITISLFFLFFSLLSSSDYSNLYQLMHGQVVRIFAHLCLKLVFVYVDHHDKCKASFDVIILQYLQRMILLDQSPLSHIISNYYMYLPLKKEHITTQ